MKVIIEYLADKNGVNGDELEEIIAKNVVDGPDLFPEFIEITKESGEKEGRIKIYVAKNVIKRFEIHEK